MSDGTPSAADYLRSLGDKIRDGFSKNRRVMAYSEYLAAVLEAPRRHLRAAPQYVKDAVDYYGCEDIEYPWGTIRRYRVFDCPWADGRDRLIGQEEVQGRVYRALENFVHEGTSNKLVLLHGPNGSAKSTLVRCLGRGLQHYSTLDDGCLYRYNWIFPAEKLAKGGIGFSGTGYESAAPADSYAYLPDELIDAKLHDELRDHPLFLLPAVERRAFLTRVAVEHPELGDFVLSDYLQFGRLSHRNRIIYEALLASYQGDYLKVLRHVQVERFYIRSRYREGFVTVEPQLAVDARETQITMDRSVAALPAALQSLTLYEYSGEVVNANRGLIEYSDLLKRPLEAYKYLLTTVEHASLSLPNATLFLDLVFIGTTNEVHLSAFKEIAEFQSFKGRLELVRVPYLLDFQQEEQIYEQKIREAAGTRHVAPHCSYVAALWAVLTRMRKPQADAYPKNVANVVAKLTPMQKAELYALGRAPEELKADDAKELVAQLRSLWTESESLPDYEGRSGASPRELLTAIFNAGNSAQYTYVSPLAVLGELEDLVKQVSVYEFLKRQALPGGYHAFSDLIGQVRERLIDRIDDEVRSSLGLVEETEYERVFQRYVTHVMHWTKKEKVFNPTTKRNEDPDEKMMREVEKTLEVGSSDSERFRHDLITRIGAWSIDHPGAKPEYTAIFADYFKRLKKAYFEKQKKIVGRGVNEMLMVLTGGGKTLSEEGRKRGSEAVEKLKQRFGYIDDSARDSVQLLVRSRYAQ